MYHCFGAWTTAADDTDAPYQRLTTVQYLMDDGAIMGLINELGADRPPLSVRCKGEPDAIRVLWERSNSSRGTSPAEGTMATPAPGTPGAGQNVVRAVFELMLPQGS